MTVKYKTGGILVYEWQVDFRTYARTHARLFYSALKRLVILPVICSCVSWGLDRLSSSFPDSPVESMSNASSKLDVESDLSLSLPTAKAFRRRLPRFILFKEFKTSNSSEKSQLWGLINSWHLMFVKCSPLCSNDVIVYCDFTEWLSKLLCAQMEKKC